MSQQTFRASPESVSVIICAYTQGRWDQILEAVDSVRNQTRGPKEIVLVVDHNDELLARSRAQFPDVLVAANAGRRGLSGARNTGVQASCGDIVAFLDDDAVAHRSWLERLVGHYAAPEVCGVGGAVEPLWTTGEGPSYLPPEFYWVVGCSYKGLPTQAADVRNFIGANMSFRRDVFEWAGWFESEIGRIGTRPLGCEETELCIRAVMRRPTSRLIYDPEARVGHHVAPERVRWRYFRSRCYAEGLSKAAVVRLSTSKSGLASERTYTFQTLPLGVLGGLRDTLVRRDPTGLKRSGAIVAGLGITVAGYVVGTTTGRRLRTPERPAAPIGLTS